MNKKTLTRAQFIELMKNNASVLYAAPRRKTAEFEKQIDRFINHTHYINQDAECRIVVTASQNRIVFSNGSIFDFQAGSYNLTEYRNAEGFRFVVVKHTYTDAWDGVEYSNYIIYGLLAADSSEEPRDWHGFEVCGQERKDAFYKFLKRNGYKYEASGITEKITHYSVFCSEKEIALLLSEV